MLTEAGRNRDIDWIRFSANNPHNMEEGIIESIVRTVPKLIEKHTNMYNLLEWTFLISGNLCYRK